MFFIKKIGRVIWVELWSEEFFIFIERCVGLFLYIVIVFMDDIFGVVDVCVGRVDGVFISNVLDDKGSCGWIYGIGC